MRSLFACCALALGVGVSPAIARCPTLNDLVWTPPHPLKGDDVRFELYTTQAFITLATIELTDQVIRFRTRTNSNLPTPPPFHSATLVAPELATGTYAVIWDNFWINGVVGVQCPLVEWPLEVAGAPLPVAPVPVPLPAVPFLLVLLLGGLGVWAVRGADRPHPERRQSLASYGSKSQAKITSPTPHSPKYRHPAHSG